MRKYAIGLLSIGFIVIFSEVRVFADTINSNFISMQNGLEMSVPDGKTWILKKDSVQSKSLKLYVKGVFYLSKDVIAEITPPTDLAPSNSRLFGDVKNDEVEVDIPNGAEYDIYFREGAKIRVLSNNGPVTFSVVAPQ